MLQGRGAQEHPESKLTGIFPVLIKRVLNEGDLFDQFQHKSGNEMGLKSVISTDAAPEPHSCSTWECICTMPQSVRLLSSVVPVGSSLG